MAMVTSLRTQVNPGTHMVEREWTLSSCPLTSACTCTVVNGHTYTLVMKQTNKQTKRDQTGGSRFGVLAVGKALDP